MHDTESPISTAYGRAPAALWIHTSPFSSDKCAIQLTEPVVSRARLPRYRQGAVCHACSVCAGPVCRSPTIGGHGTQIKSPLIGMVNVYNILAAVAVGIATGINLKVVLLHVSATHFLFSRCFTHSRPKMMM